MQLREDTRRAVVPWVHDPVHQLKRHAVACGRSFVPRSGNNDFRKLLGLGLFLVWATITLAQAFDYGEINTVWYGVMSAVIYTIIGIQWGFELENLPIAPSIRTTDSEDN